MYWELWDTASGSIVSDFDRESDALAYVRVLLAQGWSADQLVLLYDDPAVNVENLPPACSGNVLARRAMATAPEAPTPA